MKIGTYFKLWVMLTSRTSQIAFAAKTSAILFVFAKIIRVGLFIVLLLIIISRTHALSGYTFWEVMLFYLTFNFIDSLSQFLFREVYRFRMYVIKGYFDYILLMPRSTLFRTLFGGSDILDVFLILISAGSIIFIALALLHVSFFQVIMYSIFLFNALLIAVAFHILVLGLGVLTTEVDNTIFLYRDLANMGRIPMDVYQEPVRSFLTFVIPIGILMTVPVKALLGQLPFFLAVFSIVLSCVLLLISYRFWKYSLRHYTSVSS